MGDENPVAFLPVKKKKNWKKRILDLLLFLLPIILIGLMVFYTTGMWQREITYAENTPEKIYKDLGVESLTELVEKVGDEEKGYHWEYKEGTEEKIKKISEELKKNAGMQSISENLLRKMIKSELITQLPNLGGDVQNEKYSINGDLESLEGVLFIGDSITEGLGQSGGIEGIFRGVSNSTPKQWNEHSNSTNGQPTYTTLPVNGDYIKALCIMIGTNNPYQLEDTQKLLAQLHEKYPDKTIYVQKLLPLSAPNETQDIQQAQKYNSELQNFCNTTSYTKFINATEGVEIDSKDGTHPTKKGYETLGQNLKELLVKKEGEDSEETSKDSEVTEEKFQGAIRIRRVTPNKQIGEMRNTSAGSFKKVATSVTGGSSLGTKSTIPEEVKEQMKGVSMPSGAKISFDDLSYLTIPYYDFNYNVQEGHLIVNAALADEVLLIFQELYEKKYPIEKMQLIDNYANQGSSLDYASIEDNNTSAFCYRNSSTGGSLSNHALGKAIDINPKINPCVDNGSYAHSNAAKFVNRKDTSSWQDVEEAAIIREDTEIYKIFKKYGWSWGGEDFGNYRDYQHFEKEDITNVATIDENSDQTNDNSATPGATDETSSQRHTVAIAAGHNNTNNTGAESGELIEQDLTVKVAEYVAQLMQPYTNINVVQTGSTSDNRGGVQIRDRMRLAKEADAELAVQIHFNWAGSSSANGVETYYKTGDSVSQQLAEIMTKTVSSAMGLKDRGAKVDTATQHSNGLTIIGHSDEWGFPSIVTEGGFLTGSEDAAVISTDEGLKKYAQGIVDGILEYFEIENKGYGQTTYTSTGTIGTAINSRIRDLKYVEPEKFDELVEKNDKQALDVYTLDETNKLITAKWYFTSDENVTEKTMESKLEISKNSPIDYLPSIRKYTTPIEYFIDWLIDCKDEGFVEDLVNMALDSEFIIAVQDNVTTTQTTEDIQHRELERNHFEGHTTGYYTDTLINDWYTANKTINIVENVSVSIELTYADTWFVRAEKESNYSSVSIRDGGNYLVADEAGCIGNFKITTYCAACNTPPGSLATAAGVDATTNHTIAVYKEQFTNPDSPLYKGKQVVINGQVYTVEDTGNPSHRWSENWCDIFIETEGGRCVCNYSSLNSDSTPVYIAENVREADNSNSKKQTLVNGIANVKGKVNDRTTVDTQDLGEEILEKRQTEGSRYYYWAKVRQKRKITTIRTISNTYDTGESTETGKEAEFVKIFKESKDARWNVKPEWLFTLLEKSEKTKDMIDLTKYLLYKAIGGTGYGVTEFDYSIYDLESFTSISSNSGDIPLYVPSVSKEDFVKALEEFSKTRSGRMKEDFDKHFLSRAEEIYELGELYGINPELVVVFAYAEQGFHDPVGDESNFYGLATPNGSSSPSYGSFEGGVKALAEYFKKYNTGAGTYQEQTVLKYYNERQGYNPNGYGMPGTLKGMLSVYTQLLGSGSVTETGSRNVHYEGDAGGLGGTPYLKIIYGDKFEEKCGSVHKLGVDHWTTEEYADASAYVYEQRYDKWETIFGKYANIGGGEILEVAERCWKWVCSNISSYGGTSIPPRGSIDCSGYVTWVLYEMGYTEFNYQWNTREWISKKDVLRSKYGWEIIEIGHLQDISDIVQPGDIIDRADLQAGKGHMNIAVSCQNGRLLAYDCGGVGNWKNSGGNPIDKSYFLVDQYHASKGQSTAGIIIRGVKAIK